MRLILILALSALSAVAAAADEHKDLQHQFIDQSVVTYPTSLDSYIFLGGSYDPAQVAAGVSLNYKIVDAPGHLQFNIYVYPLGRADTAKAVADAVVEIEGEIREMERRKMYSDLKFGDPVPFDVANPTSSISDSDDRKERGSASDSASGASSGAKGSGTKSSATKDADTQAILAALAASQPPARTAGRKRALTLTVEGKPSQSLAYVFYRNLFLISVRATAPADAMPSDRFNALVDRAVRDLVPTMDIQNFGDCGTIYITAGQVKGDTDKDVLAGAVYIAGEAGRVQREACSGKPDPKTATPPGHERQTIVYPTQFWK